MSNQTQQPVVDKQAILTEMRANRVIEEKKWLVTPVKKASRTLTNILATAENYSEVGRIESAKSILESIKEIPAEDWDDIKYFL